MTSAVLTPFHGSPAVELGNRIWRKRVLPVGDVEYKGRLLHFTRDYLGQLVAAFQSRAYDQVPFQLADAANTHTNDPERTRGEITAMELGDDGLWVTAQLTPEGEQVLAANPRLGVSARIVEEYARSDGARFPAAIQHVLGTLDPRIPGLGPWQAIEAATPQADTVVDLSALTFAGEEASPSASPPVPFPDSSTPPEGTPGMADLTSLTDLEKQRLTRLLELPDETLDALASGGMVISTEELEALTAPGEGGGEGGEGEPGDELLAEIDAMSAEELAALEAEWAATEGGYQPADYEPEYEPEGEPVTAGLSAEAQFAIDLANARAAETAAEMAVVTARLRTQDYEAEKRRLGDLGVPGLIVEMARPLLEGNGRTVELANGQTADAGQIMRQVLTEYAAQARLLDLDVELGSPLDEPAGAADEAQAAQMASDRMSTVARFKSVTGL